MLRVSGLAVGYGGEPVLDGIDLDVAAGEFATLIGPSGSGKTSILRVVTGLLEPLRGTVDLDVGVRDVGFLFQDDALLPWRTARQNVALGLRIREVPVDAAAASVPAAGAALASQAGAAPGPRRRCFSVDRATPKFSGGFLPAKRSATATSEK